LEARLLVLLLVLLLLLLLLVLVLPLVLPLLLLRMPLLGRLQLPVRWMARSGQGRTRRQTRQSAALRLRRRARRRAPAVRWRRR
jgi:hypothetical protein